MIRLLGAALIAGSSLALGLCQLARLRDRRDTLDDLCRMLRLFKAELSTRLSPLPELMARALPDYGGRTGDMLFKVCQGLGRLGEVELSQLWKEAVEETMEVLEREELSALIALGSALGRYRLQRQIEELDICLSRLQEGLDRLRLELPERRRLSLGLSLTGGLLLAITLM